jgi:PAS domain S-box-containing protein
MQQPLNVPPFLATNGEMGNLMRSHKWSESILGTPDTWPQSLKAKLNTIMSSAFPMFLFWGEDLTCFYNDAFRPSLGIDGKHPALGKKGKDVWSDIWEFIGPLIEQVMTTGKPVWFEDQLVPFYRNGKTEDIYWTFSYSAVTNDLNEINGVFVICTETTEKVNLLKKLEESHNLYSFAIDASELGTWDLNPRTNKFLANARLKEWFGLGPDEEVELPLAINAMVEKDRERVFAAIQRALEWSSGGHYDIEYTIVNSKTGQERIVKAKGKASFNEQHQAHRFNGTLQDITAEVLTREENQKLAILVENSVDLMAILKLDGKNSYINKAGKAILGIDEDADVTQIPISDFHTPEQFAFVASELIPSVMSKGKWAGEFSIRNAKTGEIIPLYNNCHRIDNERTGEPIAVGTVMRDIRSELNARQRLEEEVSERTKELMKLNEQLERKNKDLASFAFVSSHDLQEPLRKINTFISRIGEDDNDLFSEKNADYFNRIKSSASRMQTLINDLLSFSKTSTSEGQFVPTDLNLVLAEVSRDFQYKLKTVQSSLDFGALPTINLIPFQIQQLFNNLIGNSIKFARTGVPLKITVKSELTSEGLPETLQNGDKYFRVTFEDNGIGFDPQYRDRIFEVFQRLHGRDAYEGSGIGLSICKRIMENHNGFITAEGMPDNGARFQLYFPARL